MESNVKVRSAKRQELSVSATIFRYSSTMEVYLQWMVQIVTTPFVANCIIGANHQMELK